MKLYAYILKNDGGFAPNPFFGFCTLATCKPKIRKNAPVGSWIAGIGSKTKGWGGKLLYAMKVTESLLIEEYGDDPRFRVKRPNLKDGNSQQRNGDNAYRKVNGTWQRDDSVHTLEQMDHDLGGKRVLISDHFYYFGVQAKTIPEDLLAEIQPGRGHRVNFSDGVPERFVAWLESVSQPGKHGDPTEFDDSFDCKHPSTFAEELSIGSKC